MFISVDDDDDDVRCWLLAITRAQQLEAEVDMSMRLEANTQKQYAWSNTDERTRERKKPAGENSRSGERCRASAREKSHCSRPCLVKTYAICIPCIFNGTQAILNSIRYSVK